MVPAVLQYAVSQDPGLTAPAQICLKTAVKKKHDPEIFNPLLPEHLIAKDLVLKSKELISKYFSTRQCDGTGP